MYYALLRINFLIVNNIVNHLFLFIIYINNIISFVVTTNIFYKSSYLIFITELS